MIKKSRLKILFAILSLLLMFNSANYAQKTDCSTMTDDQIIQAIYDRIKENYPDQMDHINIRIADGALTLEGWVTTQKVKKNIEKYAKKYLSKKKYGKTGKCLKEIVNKLTIGIGGGCGPGQKQCGSICIPEGEKCNVRG